MEIGEARRRRAAGSRHTAAPMPSATAAIGLRTQVMKAPVCRRRPGPARRARQFGAATARRRSAWAALDQRTARPARRAWRRISSTSLLVEPERGGAARAASAAASPAAPAAAALQQLHGAVAEQVGVAGQVVVQHEFVVPAAVVQALAGDRPARRALCPHVSRLAHRALEVVDHVRGRSTSGARRRRVDSRGRANSFQMSHHALCPVRKLIVPRARR